MSVVTQDAVDTGVSKSRVPSIFVGFQSRELTAMRFARGSEGETLPPAPLAAKDLSITWSLGQTLRLGVT